MEKNVVDINLKDKLALESFLTETGHLLEYALSKLPDEHADGIRAAVVAGAGGICLTVRTGPKVVVTFDYESFEGQGSVRLFTVHAQPAH